MGVAITSYNYRYISFYVLCCYWFICLLLLESLLISVATISVNLYLAAYFCSARFHKTDNHTANELYLLFILISYFVEQGYVFGLF